MFGQAVEESVEETVEQSGTDVDVDWDEGDWSFDSDDGSMSFDSTTEWPDDISSDVPEFEYGQISSVSSVESTDGETSWYIYYSDLDSGGYDDYADDLESAGWNIDTQTTSGGYNYLTASKGDLGVSFSFDSSSDYASLSVYTGY